MGSDFGIVLSYSKYIINFLMLTYRFANQTYGHMRLIIGNKLFQKSVVTRVPARMIQILEAFAEMVIRPDGREHACDERESHTEHAWRSMI